ncbi:hypothetical protein [Pseudomonas caricapapayae]|uniref:hypothetical protein n=1 Tax=Pseudomonas caricapapayae TaxID=46678 RepID=UPI000A7B2C68|nr:hypothetical protein [Pseudomonas caricapapayae]
MKNVKLFDTAASLDRVLLEVVVDGVVGIFGGRLAVRDLAGEVGAWLELRGYALAKKLVIYVQGRRTITLGQNWHTFLMKINIAMTKHSRPLKILTTNFTLEVN